MKKMLSISLLLFAATLSFSAPAGAKGDRILNRVDIILPTPIHDMPIAEPGCKKPPPCPQAPPLTYF